MGAPGMLAFYKSVYNKKLNDRIQKLLSVVTQKVADLFDGFF